MATTVSGIDYKLPKIPEAKFHISEHEPLVWLISIIFTNQFWDRKNLTNSNFLYGLGGNLEMGAPPYGSMPELYSAIEKWVKEDEKASVCYDKVMQAIETGELAYYAPEADKWGDRPYYEPDRDIHSYTFLVWLQNNGYDFSEDIVNAARYIISTVSSKIEAEKKEAYSYPAITAEDFVKLKKEPLWHLEIGILYLMGRRSRRTGKEREYKGENGLLEVLIGYAVDAYRAGTLKIFPESYDGIDKLRVIPAELISWIQTLPVSLPMVNPQIILPERPAHCTPDMALMYDAIKQFWENYDLSQPNPSVAPMKKDVVGWLIEEAKKRGITDFSKTRAESLDTIIRCPQARRGGNTL